MGLLLARLNKPKEYYHLQDCLAKVGFSGVELKFKKDAIDKCTAEIKSEIKKIFGNQIDYKADWLDSSFVKLVKEYWVSIKNLIRKLLSLVNSLLKSLTNAFHGASTLSSFNVTTNKLNINTKVVSELVDTALLVDSIREIKDILESLLIYKEVAMKSGNYSDLERLDGFKKKINEETDPEKNMTIVDEAIKFTDMFSMSRDLSLAQTVTSENIHYIAGYRSDFLERKMKLLFEKGMRLLREVNQEAANECERKYLECCKLFDEAITKVIEPMRKLS